MDQQIHSSTPPLNPQLSTTVKQAAVFLQNIDNTKKTWRGLSYPEVFNLVRDFVQVTEPQTNLENISVEDLSNRLNKIVPGESPESKEGKDKAEIFKQKEVQALQNFLQKTRATENLIKSAAQKLSQGFPTEKLEAVTKTIINEVGVRTDLSLAFKKVANLPAEKRQAEEQKIAEQVQDSFRQALPFAASKLQKQGVVVTPKEEEAINEVIPSLEELPLITNELTLPAPERQEMASWLKEQLLPITTLNEARQIAEILVPAVVEKLPEIDPNTFGKLSETEFTTIQTQFEEAAVEALSEVALEIGEISPQKVSRIVAAFIPQRKEELKESSPFLVSPKDSGIINFSPRSTEPIEITQLPTKFPRFLASPLRRTAEGNVWHTQNREGVRFVDELRAKLSKEGINKGNSFSFRNKVLEHWALYLTAEKITPEDIDYTIEKLLNAGEKEDSPQIKELRETRLALVQFQQTLPSTLLEKIKKEGALEGKKGGSLIQIPSRFGTAIIRKTVFDPKFNLATRINSFFGRVFGKQVISLSSGQTVYVNKIAFLGHRFFEAFKTHFFSTAIGQGIKTALYQLGQNSLQNLWTTAKIGISTGIKKGVSSILVKVGLHAVAGALSAGIANVVILVAPKLIKGVISSVKKVFGIFGGFSAIITGQQEVPENKDLKFLVPVLGCLAIVVFFLPILNTITTGGAFIVPPSLIPSSTRYVGPFPPEVIHPVCVEGPNSLTNFIGGIAEGNCVPPAMLVAISQTEAGGVWSFSCDEINNFSQSSWWEDAEWTTRCRGYCYNTCGPEPEARKPESQGGCGKTWDPDCGSCNNEETTVYGPMQFEECTWGGLMPDYSSMDRCRLDLSFVAASVKIKGASGTGADQCNNWSEEVVRQVAKNYCGSCGTGSYNEETKTWEGGCWDNPPGWTDSCSPSCGVDYCGAVWYRYQQYANQ